jgi:recombinational DNA repair protein (RecF pathway)
VSGDCDCATCLRADICVECDSQIDPTRFYLGTVGPLCAVCRDRRSSMPMIGEIQEAGGVEAATANGQTQGLLF